MKRDFEAIFRSVYGKSGKMGENRDDIAIDSGITTTVTRTPTPTTATTTTTP